MDCNVLDMSMDSMSESGDEEELESRIKLNDSYLGSDCIKIPANFCTSGDVTPHDTTFSPLSSTSTASSASVLHPENNAVTCSSPENIACLLDELGIRVNSNEKTDENHWLGHLCRYLTKAVGETPREGFKKYISRLKRHLYQRKNGTLAVDLIAASMLKIHPDIKERATREINLYVSLPSPIFDRLLYGKFVPIRHIIYGDALKKGYEVHYKEKCILKADPYPLHIKEESPPEKFIDSIKRPDIFRAVTSHSLILSLRFQALAANMHFITRDLWNMLYEDDVNLQLAMNVYDEYFKQFENQLCSLSVQPITGFSADLINWVKLRYYQKCK